MSEKYRDPSLPAEARAEDLLRRMRREEKIGQLGQFHLTAFLHCPEELEEGLRAGRWGSRIGAESAFAGSEDGPAIDPETFNAHQSIAVGESRLGIPLLLGRDVIYGHRTVCPIPLSQAASFNPGLVEKAMSCVAREAHAEGVRWTFSPVMDLSRDPRWGRVIEGYGEDPLLISEMGAAAIRGFQGNDPSEPGRLLACAKHFAGYGGSEGGRDYDTAEWSENTLRNMILPPFAAAARAGVASVMAGFNDLGGTPVSSSRALIRDWLKTEQGWDGFVVSDWGSIFDLIGHRVAEHERDAARLAFSAGIDMEMTAGIYEREIGRLIDDGAIPEEWLNDAVRRILIAKFRAGLFERPFIDSGEARSAQRAAEHVAAALELATQSIVLLKNAGGVLPLETAGKTVAVVGPYASARREHLGSWCLDGHPEDVTTILEGLRAEAPDTRWIESPSHFSDAATNIARTSDFTILCLGENHQRNGEHRSSARLGLPPDQILWIDSLARLGLPFVLVDCSGRFLPCPEAELHARAILHAGSLGTEAGTAIARVLLGKSDPSGHLPVSVPRCEGQIPVHYNRKTPGKTASIKGYRAYEDSPGSPLYPFGYGLGYTAFSLEETRLSSETVTADTPITASAEVSNTGSRHGAAVVQLYIQDRVSSTTRPERELKAFRRIELPPGGRETLHFDITGDMLAFFNADGKWTAEPGSFQLALGFDSRAPFTHSFSFR